MSRWPINKAHFWERAPFFRILLPFAAGILSYYMGWLLAIPVFWFLPVTLVLFLAMAILLFLRNNKAVTTATFIVTNMLLFSGGMSISAYNDIRNNRSWFGNHINPAATYLARISSAPVEKEKSWKLEVNVIKVIDSTSAAVVTGKAFIYLEKDGANILRRGDTIMVAGNWELISDAGNPFEFSYASHCARNNIIYRQWCSANDLELYAAGNPAYLPFTERAHDWSMRQLGRYLGRDNARGLLQAMILGDEINLDEDLRQAYADTGIVHIIAISGGNITIFFIVVAFLLGWIRHKKYVWVKYAVALPIIWFYVLMAGAQPSAMRAAVMFSIMAFGIMMQKNKNGFNQLLAAAFALLCSEPAWLFSIGFQLSFIAVLSILLFYKHVYNLLPITGRSVEEGGSKVLKVAFTIADGFGSVVSMSIAAEILVAPVVMYYFHTYPIMFALANIAAFIFMSITLVAGVVLVAVSPIPFLAQAVAAFIRTLVHFFSFIVGHLQGAGPRSFKFLMINGYETIIFYMLIAGITTYILKGNRKALLAGLSAACLLLCSLCLSEWNRLHQQKFIVYNVPRANHVDLVRGARYTVLCTDTLLNKKVNYAIRPAHIGWRAWEEQEMPRQDIFSINGKTVLVLNDRLTGTGHFPVDYLVLNTAGKPDMKKLLKTITPSMVIVSNNYSKKQLARITDGCKRAGIAMHNVATQGAFILSN